MSGTVLGTLYVLLVVTLITKVAWGNSVWVGPMGKECIKLINEMSSAHVVSLEFVSCPSYPASR